MDDGLVDHVYVMKPSTNSGQQGLERFQVGGHMEVLGGWRHVTPRGQELLPI